MNYKKLIKPREFRKSALMKLGGFIPAKLYLKMLFKMEMGYRLNLEVPQTFHEKLQWLKLYNRQPEYRIMVDKAAVKDYVANIIGEKYLIPTLGIWDRPEDIEWDKLPKKFVLKTTHGGGSGGVVICTNKDSFDKDAAIQKLNNNLKTDIWTRYKEWQYKDVPRRILAEQYLEDKSTSVKGDLNDYKFYCFNGKVTYCEVITGRRTKKQIDFFDLEWNHVPFTFEGRTFADNKIQKPECFEEMIDVAKKLSENLPFSRIDMYVVHGKVYFGEITFFPASGFRGYNPPEWNRKLGDMIQLPKVTK